MIKLAGVDETGLKLIQAAEHPVVYLDHWAYQTRHTFATLAL